MSALSGAEEMSGMVKKDYTERVEIVPCDDGWPGYEETVVEFYKNCYEPPRDGFVLIEMKWGWDCMFFP